MSYVGYYKSLVDKSNLNKHYDLTKFQTKIVKDFADEDNIHKLSKYIDTCIKSNYPNEVLVSVSYDAVTKLHFEMYEKIGRKLLSYMNSLGFGCNFEIHRAYLFQNNYRSNKTEKINCDKFHWKNEPKTIITAYIRLDDDNMGESIQFLENTKTKITMPTSKYGINQWGSDNHFRFNNCRFNDGQVSEYMHMGFSIGTFKSIKCELLLMGNNVVHKHCHNNHRYLVLKMRPTKYDITKLSSEEIQSRIGDILDIDVSPSSH